MFAVPGWSLGQLKTEQPQDSQSKDKRSSKKRKRNHEAKDGSSTEKKSGVGGGASVTGQNVAELWKQHVEKADSHSKASKDSRTKTRKLQADASTTTALLAEPNTDGEEGSGYKQQGEEVEERRQNHKKNKKRPRKASGGREDASKQATSSMPPTKQELSSSKLTPMQAAMRQKLMSARFRHLNQTLYTAPSQEANQLFQANPSFFEEYHAGFRQQVSGWPENPVDSFLDELKLRGAMRSQGKGGKGKPAQQQQQQPQQQQAPLPRSSGTCFVADLGCGDARLAKELQRASSKLNVKVLSYDLQSDSPLVTKADVSRLPLESGSVNVAVLCLALMGTNWIDFVEEAWRVLHWKGELWVAEIKSRFARAKDKQVHHSIGKRRKATDKDLQKKEEAEEDEEQLRVQVDGSTGTKGQTDVSAFVQVMERRGFALRGHDGVDLSNKMFVRLHFTKSKTPTKGGHAARESVDDSVDVADETTVLKPCLYKIR